YSPSRIIMSFSKRWTRLASRFLRADCRKTAKKRRVRGHDLLLEHLESRETPAAATYSWDGAGTLNITLSATAAQSLTIAETAGTRPFPLATGTDTWTQGGTTAATNAANVLTFSSTDNISTLITIGGGFSTGTDNITFGGGNIQATSIAANVSGAS